MLDEIFNPQFNITYACNMYSICKYCYAEKFARETGRKHMASSDFDMVIGWLQALDVKDIVFIGGEPTLHPDLDEFLAILEKHRLRCRVFTNGSSPKKAIKSICQCRAVNEIFFHYDDVYISSNRSGAGIFFRNLDHCLEQGKNIYLRYNISDKDFDFTGVLETAEKYKAPIGYSLSAPAYGICSGIPLYKISEFLPQLKAFVVSAKQKGVQLILGRPLPRCMIREEELSFWQRYAGFKSVCEPINDLTINPDLTVQLCSVLFNTRYPKPLSTAQSLIRAIDGLKNTARELQAIPPMQACKSCRFFPLQCQGGCLSYKVYAEADLLYQ